MQNQSTEIIEKITEVLTELKSDYSSQNSNLFFMQKSNCNKVGNFGNITYTDDFEDYENIEHEYYETRPLKTAKNYRFQDRSVTIFP